MDRKTEGRKEETGKHKRDLKHPYASFFFEEVDLDFEGKDFLKHQKEMLIAMSGTHKKVLWVEVILPTAGRRNE